MLETLIQIVSDILSTRTLVERISLSIVFNNNILSTSFFQGCVSKERVGQNWPQSQGGRQADHHSKFHCGGGSSADRNACAFLGFQDSCCSFVGAF